ncbi:hypothetical protein [Desulfosporosinus sp. OT]|nr:hypothetical protein [Desulfosporosinus sp. OT]EGW41878.1 hypothetical protein DOT_0177 [Desulfosporosinus sp. OT]
MRNFLNLSNPFNAGLSKIHGLPEEGCCGIITQNPVHVQSTIMGL